MVNLKLALRTLFKTPFVTGVAVLSLALGIGANSAIFSLFNQMLLRPLPVHEPDRLVTLGAPGPKPGSTSCNQAGPCDVVFSYPMFRDLERVQESFTGLAAHRSFGANLAYKGQVINGSGAKVSGSYFPVLGLQPALGRLIGPSDDPSPGQAPVVVLSYEYWRTHFDRNPAVLNDTLIVNGQSLTIIGVAPQDFHGATMGSRPHVYVPITLREQMIPGWKGLDNRRNYWVYLFARLKPGVSIEQARAAINVPYSAIVNDVEAPLQTGMSDQTMERFRTKQVAVEEGARGQSSIHREAQAPIFILFGVTGFVLLIACANIANLLLARSATRATEMAVRLSIGANRWQLVRQLLLESCLLALMGGLLGILVAGWTLDFIATILPAEAVRTVSFEVDRDAAIFATILAVATGIAFGLFPALHSTRPDLITTLKGNSGQPSGAKSAARFRTSLVTSQIAISMALLIAAGLFTRSLLNVSRVDLGLETDNLITFGVSPELNGYSFDQSRAFFERLEAELASEPGVNSVTASMVPLIAGSNWGNSLRVQGFDAGPDTDTNAQLNEVGPGFFRTMGIPLMRGREFTQGDALGAPKVAIVNQALARKFNLGDDAVGKRIGVGGGPDTELDIEIVGLVQDAKYSEVKRAIPPQYFVPYRQDDEIGSMYFYVRTNLTADQALGMAPRVVTRLDPNLPLEDLRTMDQQVRENVFIDRMISTLSSGFALLATVLAAIGLYGVLAYTVSQRTREIGLRMALGADGGNVRAMVLRQVGRMTLVGGLVGIVAAIGIGRAAESQLFELKGYDPAVLITSAVVLTLVAMGAGFLPALKASRVDPMRALRYE